MAGLAGEVLRLAIWLGLLAAVFVPLERLFGARAQSLWRRDSLVDLGHFFLNGLTLSLALAVPAALLAVLAAQVVPSWLVAAVASWPLWLQVLAALVLGDLGAYWGHRWSHEIPLLWRFHAVHHSAEEVDWLVNTRAHPVDLVVTRFCGLVPLYATGLAQAAEPASLLPALVAAAGTVWSFFIHANLRVRLGWLEQIVSTPAFHRWHHSNEAVRDRNYAAILPVIDRVFGTFHLPDRLPTRCGIDSPMPASLAGQLAQPFRPQRAAR